ncbi:hypothetical protein [uncultured Bacteroides sp.]|uniref:hypothetical protein n=1 Tax=uncultured Bacteroides sp. TaxID=162156 RepID=UPI0025E3E9E8|nr:hypothetical protein [uncultured Bacteroides sp.]
MNITDFKQKFPDVHIQRFETKAVLSRVEIEDMVKQFMTWFGGGLVAYESRGRNIKVFTSEKMKRELEKLKPGCEVTCPLDGRKGTVMGEVILICGTPCIRIEFDGKSDMYDCETFID